MALKDLVVNIGADTTGFNSGVKNVRGGLGSLSKQVVGLAGAATKTVLGSAREMKNGIALAALEMGEGFKSGFEKAARESKSLTTSMESTQSQLQALLQKAMESLDSEFDKLAQRASDIKDAQTKILASGGNKDDPVYRAQRKEMGELLTAMETVLNKKKELSGGGLGGNLGNVSSEITSLQRQASVLNSELDKTQAKLNEIGEPSKFRNLANGFSSAIKSIPAAAAQIFHGVVNSSKVMLRGIANVAKRMGSLVKQGLQKVGGVIKGVFSKITGFFRRGEKSSGSFTKALNGSLGVLVRMAKRRLFTAIFNQAKEGVQELAKFSPAFNKSMSDMQSSMKYTGNAFAAAFAPIMQTVVPYLTILIDKLAQAMNAVAQFSGVLLGQKTVATAVKTQENYAASLDKTADSAKNAAKEAKKSVATYDEINQLSNSSGAEDATGSGAGSSSPFTYGAEDVLGAGAFADQIKSAFNAGDFEALGAAFADKANAFIHKLQNLDWDGISDKVNTAVSNFARAVNGFVDRLDWGAIGDVIGKGLNVAFGGINTFFKTINWERLGQQLSNGLNGLIHSFDWVLAGETVGNGINAAIDTLHGAVTTFDWKGLGKGFADSVNTLFKTVDWEKAGQTLSSAIRGVLSSANEFMKETDWLEIGESIKTTIENVDWTGITEDLSRFVGGAIGALTALLKPWWDKLKEDFTNTARAIGNEFDYGIWNGITALFYRIRQFFLDIGFWVQEHIVNPFVEGFRDALGIHSPSKVFLEIGELCIEGFKQGVKDLWAKVKKFFIDAVYNIQDTFSSIGVWFGEKFTEAWENIKSAFSNIGSFFSGIWNTIKSSFTDIGQRIGDAVAGAFKKAVNSVMQTLENTVNTPIRAINSLIDVVKMVPGLGGLGYLKEFNLPRLAQGGVLEPRDPRLVIMGDNRHEREIAAPESAMRDVMRKVLREERSGGTAQRFDGTLRLLLEYPDGRVLAKILNMASLAEGRQLLEV